MSIKYSNPEIDEAANLIRERISAEAAADFKVVSGEEEEIQDTNGSETQAESATNELPPRPTSDAGQEVEYPPLKPEDETEALGNLSKLVEVGDPVMLQEVRDDGKEVWYIDKVGDSRDGEMKIRIHYRADDAELEEFRTVTWDEITPRYQTAEAYRNRLGRLNRAYKKAKEQGVERERKRLATLLLQLRHFAQIFYQEHKNSGQDD